MVFSSAAFLSVLFPLAVLGCLALRRWVRAQNMLLLALSLVFYAWGEIGFLPVMALSADTEPAHSRIKSSRKHRTLLFMEDTLFIIVIVYFSAG